MASTSLNCDMIGKALQNWSDTRKPIANRAGCFDYSLELQCGDIKKDENNVSDKKAFWAICKEDVIVMRDAESDTVRSRYLLLAGHMTTKNGDSHFDDISVKSYNKESAKTIVLPEWVLSN